MKYIPLLFCFLFCSGSLLNAQCSDDNDEFELPPESSCSDCTIPLTLWIVHRDDGTGGVGETDVDAIKTAIIAAYSGADITVSICDRKVNNTGQFNANSEISR